ncbi:MAG TPA: type II secretion system protein N [Pseudolabrys sp.]|nr:type II secretion system protein N [Pseudolabrys sp.]
MTAAIGFKRLGYAVAGIAILGFAVFAAMSLLISTDRIRDAVKAEVHAATGLDPILRGAVTVSLFPSGSVSFSDVVLGDERDGKPALAAERLTARLRFFPLLTGRAEIADISLDRPTITVSLDGNGRSNWSGLIEALARGQTPAAPRLASFSEIRIDGGTVILRDNAHNSTETLNDVELSLAWPSISKSFGATGRFKWRDEPVDLSLTLGDFAATLAGTRSGLKLRVAGAPLKLAFDGSLSTKPTLRVEGTLAADAASLREALRWTAQKSLPGGGFGRFALKAQTNITAGTIALSGVNMELDGNSAEGVLTFATEGRQTLQGTLATDRLDLRPYVSTVRLLAENRRQWDSMPIVLDGINGFDLDLRLSAAQVQLSDAKLGRTALAANLRGGHLMVTIGESQAFGGLIRGSFTMADSEPGVDVKTQLQFADVDLESCLGQLFGTRRLEGKGNLSLSLEGAGLSVLAVTRTLSGSASLVGRNGAIAGLNVEQLLRRLERRPLSSGGEFRSGHTPYEQITVTVKVAQGIATVEDVNIEGSAVKLALGGSASIPARDLDLKGTASLLASANSAPVFELPFVVQGPWDDPIMLPDPQSLIRRSGAAAPLLNAVRERSARDAVRSAIERLTGAPTQPNAAAPAAATPALQPANSGQ